MFFFLNTDFGMKDKMFLLNLQSVRLDKLSK